MEIYIGKAESPQEDCLMSLQLYYLHPTSLSIQAPIFKMIFSQTLLNAAILATAAIAAPTNFEERGSLEARLNVIYLP
jgi:hypothetical protein